ncbi:MAG: putative toxin-antitoxin system toxin component, PIN family [Terracidiphilus sp.]|nr:putative toxin-antitoxin system toxin component, PIN family [Terracidiphilus sp.]
MTGKVVIDTSTLVSAAIRPDSVPDRALTLALKEGALCASAGVLEELQSVLGRSRFDAYVDLDSRLALMETIRSNAQFFVIPPLILEEVQGSCRDPRDDHILALSLAAEAEIIVSSDHDLLVLKPWRGIPILTPAQFLTRYSETHSPEAHSTEKGSMR